MFRFGTGFGLLKCRLSEFNDDIHGEPDSIRVKESEYLIVSKSDDIDS